MSISKTSFGTGSVANKSNKLIFFIIFIAMSVVLAGSLFFFSKVIQTETYWVLSQPVPQRAMVTMEHLKQVEVNKGGAPLPVSQGGVALTDVEVSQGGVFTRIPLQPGDILTTSNTTSGLSDVRVGLPDDWTVTTLEVNADNAAGGRITRGTYFDILAVTKEGETFYPYINVLCLDTSVSLNNASSAAAASTGEAKTGQTEIYYIGMPPYKIAELQALLATDVEIKLTLSPIQNDYNSPNFDQYLNEDGSRIFKFNMDSELEDSGLGTDNTFTKIERDEFGRPAQVWPDGTPKSGDLTELGVGDTRIPFSEWENWMSEYEGYLANKPDTLDPTGGSTGDTVAPPTTETEESTTEE